MKATIDEKGELKVIPESALEAFALDQWARRFAPFNDIEILDISRRIHQDGERHSLLAVSTAWPRAEGA